MTLTLKNKETHVLLFGQNSILSICNNQKYQYTPVHCIGLFTKLYTLYIVLKIVKIVVKIGITYITHRGDRKLVTSLWFL